MYIEPVYTLPLIAAPPTTTKSPVVFDDALVLELNVVTPVT